MSEEIELNYLDIEGEDGIDDDDFDLLGYNIRAKVITPMKNSLAIEIDIRKQEILLFQRTMPFI